MVDRTVQNKAA